MEDKDKQEPTILEILYEDDDLIAINKPHGLLVHRSRIAKDAKEFALQMVRNQIGQHVYLAHRLDRKTSGVLLLTKSKEIEKTLHHLFSERHVQKTYIAIVRGYTPPSGHIDYTLNDGKRDQSAQTDYSRLATYEIPLPFRGFPTSRYSLVELRPLTGRFHQLRKHMAHIRHPILGDRPHGCNKQNRLWKDTYGMDKMMLHAHKLELEYPTGSPISISANYSKAFLSVLKILENPSNPQDIV